MRQVSPQVIAGWCGGSWVPQAPGWGVDRLCVNSQEAGEGRLFFALEGTHRDGHEFVGDVCKRGGAAVVRRGVWEGIGSSAGATVLQVEDPLRALRQIAAGWRATGLSRARIIGVTGSAGKTSTKELCANVLSQLGPTARTDGNFNNHIGLPLCVSRMNAEEVYGVFEAGVSHRGEMKELQAVMRPDAAVVTCIGPAHIEFFGTRRAIAEEKAVLLSELPRSGFAVLGLESGEFDTLRAGCTGEMVTCSREAERRCGKGAADYVGLSVAGEGDVASQRLRILETGSGEAVEVPVPPPGGYMEDNVLRAVALGRRLGASWEAISTGLTQGVRTRMRWEVVDLEGGCTAINDAYNANPLSVRAALQAFSRWPVQGGRFLALGPMRELGECGRTEHESLGRECARDAWAGLVVVAGGEPDLAEALARGFLAAGGKPSQLGVAADHVTATRWLQARMTSGDAVLLKGSRAMAMERILDGWQRNLE